MGFREDSERMGGGELIDHTDIKSKWIFRVSIKHTIHCLQSKKGRELSASAVADANMLMGNPRHDLCGDFALHAAQRDTNFANSGPNTDVFEQSSD
jgi:hypothetical protein